MFDLNEIVGKGRVLIFIIILIMIGVLLSYWTGGLPLTILMTIVITIVLFISKPIWLPKEYGKNITRNLSLLIVLSTSISFPIWNNHLNSIFVMPLLKYLQNNIGIFAGLDLSYGATSFEVLLFVFISN